MEKHRKQLANTLLLVSFLIVALPARVQPPSLRAQPESSSKGIDPDLLAKANAGDAGAELLVGLAYLTGDSENSED
jgi:hypothetical protein